MRSGIQLLLVGCMLLTAACSATRGPIGFWSRNRTDAKGERQGPWRTYHDAENQKVATKSHFRHGQQVGRISYYNAEGELVEREWAKRRSPELVRVRYYHPNGKTWRVGQARYVNEPDGLHYFWYGNWQVRDTMGRLQKVETYKAGRLVQTTPAPARQ